MMGSQSHKNQELHFEDMRFKRLDQDIIEIFLEGLSAEKVLKEIARLSYELADTIPPWFVQPFDIPAEAVNFSDLVSEKGLRIDYLNGRLCSTHVEVRNGRLLFDARRFREDRGSPEVFLTMVREILEARE